MAHRWVGTWKILRATAGYGLFDKKPNKRSKVKIIYDKAEKTWTLGKLKNVDWDDEQGNELESIKLVPNLSDPKEPTELSGEFHIGKESHSLRITLLLSEDEVLDDELEFKFDDDSGVVAGTANSGRG